MTEKCRIELVYRVWDCENGSALTIQDGDDDGVYDFEGVTFTVEQIPGIIKVLETLQRNYNEKCGQYHFTPEEIEEEYRKMNEEYDKLHLEESLAKQRQHYCCDPPVPVPNFDNARSGRPDPPF